MNLDSVSPGYGNLRKRRLGIPKEMELTDKTDLPGKRVSRKRKSCKRDKNTKKKLEENGWREL